MSYDTNLNIVKGDSHDQSLDIKSVLRDCPCHGTCNIVGNRCACNR